MHNLMLKVMAGRGHIDYEPPDWELLICGLRLLLHTAKSTKDCRYFAGNSYKIFIS